MSVTSPAEIKQKRTESLLKELIPEAIYQLNDARVHEVDVVEVTCSRGRSDAKVYLDPHQYSEKDKNFYLNQLRKATPFLTNYILRDQGWFKAPNLTFVFDAQIQKSKNIESLFTQIEKERTKKGDNNDES
ncbi:MAG: 30S ribosome-binding factor RbfA [Helicobacteraceae bacterium]|nr:30S ribosome-binding factor RbfA [Helicobacteraceae bacterium]